MEYRNLGAAGVKVSPLCLGTMMFGRWGNPNHAEVVRIIHRALDAGINFIDTANVYSHGEAEEILGRALAGRRQQVVLATKVWGAMGHGPNERGLSRRAIQEQCEASLRRLGTDVIDLYQIHRSDPEVPWEETLSALTDLVRQGKVRYLGCSTNDRPAQGQPRLPAWEIVETLALSERRGF
ncbi:MAG: aldo/keto reductase, partial [Acidobacteriota bacterium]|nr:aldo/keto reductase [Acidobacteriota bacterium]